jgi:CRP/FNR family transcriptional regulator
MSGEDGTMTKQDALHYFQELSPAGWQLLEGGVQTVDFAKPATVIHKGQRVSGAYLVTRGQLRVFTFTPQGSEATLYFIRPGETCVLALNCLFNDLRYPAWVESAADTEVAVIPGTLYRRLFEREATVQDMTVKALSTLVFRLMNELEQIHACTLDQRLANFLLSNVSDAGVLQMTQQALAGHLGTTREVIARLMLGFAAQGAVSTKRGAISVIDAEKLTAVINGSRFVKDGQA